MLKAEHISFSYQSGQKILDDISFEIHPGEFIGVIGNSGAGKTTLIKHLNGLLKATSGTLYYNSANVYAKKYPISQLRKEVGLVFQYPEHQLFGKTVLADAMYGPLNMGYSKEEAQRLAEDSLKLVGIDEMYYSYNPLELSGGQKRCVAIAGILAMDPKILVLDEPAAGLDPQTKHMIFQIIQRIQEERNVAIVLVSHHMEDVVHYAKMVWILHKGRLALQGAPKEVFKQTEKLRELGIGLPAITNLTIKMREEGIALSDIAVTVEEAGDLILSYLGKEAAHD